MIYSVLLIAFLLRILPRVILPYGLSDDSYGHCANADCIRDANHKIPRLLNGTVFRQTFGYPFFFPYLLSLVPKKHELIAERYISALSDTLNIFMAYKLFLLVINASGRVMDEFSLISFVSILALLPAFLRNDIGPRAYHGNARLIGQFFFTLAFYFFYYYCQVHSILYFILSALFGSFIFLSSTFATQAYIFTGLD